jgi:hypothetical protein
MAKKEETVKDVSDSEVKLEEVDPVAVPVEDTEIKGKEEATLADAEDEEVPVAAAAAATSTTAAAVETEEAEEVKPADVTAVEDKDVPPPRPSRPLTPRQEALKNLKDAFPSIEEKLITTVLIASSYQLERAFNSLLYYSDPDSVQIDDLVEEPPVATARPGLPQRPSQLQQDELLAKQLDEEFNRKERRRAERRQHRQRSTEGPRASNQNFEDDDDSDVFTNFVEKDLPQLKQQVSKNLEETRTKINGWVSGWKKNFSQEQETLQNQRGGQQGSRQSTRRQQPHHFEDDPEELDLQKIHGISLNDNSPGTQEDDLDLYSSSKGKKWEPLKGTKPEPISKNGGNSNNDHGVVDDDFLLSDDEPEIKK